MSDFVWTNIAPGILVLNNSNLHIVCEVNSSLLGDNMAYSIKLDDVGVFGAKCCSSLVAAKSLAEGAYLEFREIGMLREYQSK